MQFVKCALVLAVLFAGCRSTRQNMVILNTENQVAMAYAVSSVTISYETATAESKAEEPVITNATDLNLPAETAVKAEPVPAKRTTKKVTSFTQWKEMAASGEVKMSSKEIKILNKLDRKYNGNFEKFKADTFEFTTTAKIIAGVGVLGLLLAITGSTFGLFIFILSALAFILRFAGVIEF